MIYIAGEINDESYVDFSKQLYALESDDVYEDGAVIYVELISDGGSLSSAMAFWDRIKSSRLRVLITATGCANSAAMLILAAGDIRRMTRNAWVLVHEDTGGEGIGDLRIFEVERELRHLRQLEDQWNQLLADVSNITAYEWEQLNQRSAYLDASECLRLGLIEDIV